MFCAALLLAFSAAGSAAASQSESPGSGVTSGVTSAVTSPVPGRPLSWDDFPVFVWREEYAGKPLPEELGEPFGGVILRREEDSTWARERGLAYLIWNVAGRDALHLDADEAWNARVEQWIQTHDEKLLVRQPCLNDPKTIERLYATLDATIARHGEHPGLGFVLGDEVSLTPNGSPFDLCRCELCEAEWKRYAAQKGWPARAPLTDEVRVALLEGDTSSLGAWMARRRFDQDRMVSVLKGLIEHAAPLHERPLGREPPVGLLGCGGQTVFGGVALERLATQLNFIECYAVGDARVLAETVPDLWRHGLGASSGPDPRPESLSTIFLQGESAAGLAWLVWEHWLRGGDGLVLWNDRELEGLPVEARARLFATVRAVRAIRDQTFLSRPSAHPFSIALLHDADSEAASFLRDAALDGPTWPRRNPSHQNERGTRGRKIQTWIRLFEDACGRIGSLPLEQLCDDCRFDYPVLVAPELLVLDEGDLVRLERHVTQGGWLVVDGRIGWVDRRGQAYAEDVLERLRRAAPERVLAAPDRVERYLAERWNPAAREGAIGFVRELLAAAGHPLAPALPGPELEGRAARLPWLVGGFGWKTTSVYAWLPNCPTRAERDEHLCDLPLEVRAPDGFELRWLWPADGKVLRAGDAAVFLLEKNAKAR